MMIRSSPFLSCSAISFPTAINISASRLSCVMKDLSFVHNILNFEKDRFAQALCNAKCNQMLVNYSVNTSFRILLRIATVLASDFPYQFL